MFLAYAAVVISVSPASVTLHSGETQQFNVSATGLGKVRLAAVWSASAGTISQSGLFTAPVVTSSQTVTVKAARVGYQQKQYGTATITVLPAGPPPHSVDLTWDVDPDAVSYSIYRGTSPDGSFALLASAITGTAWSDAGVIAGQTYYYAATATNSAGQESGYSNEAEAVIPTP